MNTVNPEPATKQAQRCGTCNARQRPERLSLSYMLHRLREDVFGTERGLFLTLWHLFTQPQSVTSAFIKGEPLRYYSPIKYFTVMFALSLFAAGNAPFLDAAIANSISSKGLLAIEPAKVFVADWNALIYLPLVLILALATRGFFRESGFNYAEHLVIAAYGWSQMVLLGSVVFLLMTFFKWVGLKGGWLAIFMPVPLAYWIWFCRAAFSQRNLAGTVRGFVTVPFALTCFMFLIIFAISLITLVTKFI